MGLILRAASIFVVTSLCQLALASSEIGIHFDPCELTLAGTGVSRSLECAELEVPLFTGAEQSLALSVVKIAAPSKKPKLDPLLMLAGGPGQAASQAYLFADRQFQKLSQGRDIYLIDQRGTGRSSKFQCGNMSDPIFELESSQLIAQAKSLAEACLKQFAFDARYFTTSAAIADFEFVRKTLGIEQWNIYGVSYGTRVALHYLRRYPSSIRSVVIDSVVHPEHTLGVNIAPMSQAALDRLVLRCENEAVCSEAFPNLSKNTKSLIASLKAEPKTVSYEDILTGEFITTRFTQDHLAIFLRMSLYSDESASHIPLLLHEAYKKGNFAPLARYTANISKRLKDEFALGMHNSIMCTEDAAFYEFDAAELTAANTYLGDGLLKFMREVCAVWPRGLIDDDFKLPVKSLVPVLLFSGDEDPITPPSYADAASKSLQNARHLVLAGQAHNVSSIGCAPTLIAKFVDELELDQLDASCLERVQAAPFFIDFNGPQF